MTGRQADPLVSLREAARFLGVHHSTLSRAAKRGQIAPAGSTPGGWARFRLSDIRVPNEYGFVANIQRRSGACMPGNRRSGSPGMFVSLSWMRTQTGSAVKAWASSSSRFKRCDPARAVSSNRTGTSRLGTYGAEQELPPGFCCQRPRGA